MHRDGLQVAWSTARGVGRASRVANRSFGTEVGRVIAAVRPASGHSQRAHLERYDDDDDGDNAWKKLHL